MFANLPQVRVISEPWALYDAHVLYRGRQISMPQYKNLIQAAIRILLKTEGNPEITHSILKLTQFCTAQCKFFHDMLPNTKFYFMTRNLKPTLQVNFKKSILNKIYYHMYVIFKT